MRSRHGHRVNRARTRPRDAIAHQDSRGSKREALEQNAFVFRAARRTLFADARTTVDAFWLLTETFWAIALPAKVEVDAATDMVMLFVGGTSEYDACARASRAFR